MRFFGKAREGEAARDGIAITAPAMHYDKIEESEAESCSI